MKILNKSALIIFLLNILVACSLVENREFELQRLDLINITYKILIREGECLSLQECQQRQVFFASPARKGIAVQFWQLKKQELIFVLLREYHEIFVSSGAEMTLSVDFYEIPKHQSLEENFWNKTTSRLTFVFKGK